MSVDVYIRTGLNIQVTPQASPSYVIGNLPVLVGSGQQGATQGWVNSGYYPRDNPSGYATGIDGSLFVRHTESGVLLARGETGIFVTTDQTGSFGGGAGNTGVLTGAFYPLTRNPSGYISTGQLLKFSTPLNSGVESQAVNYPLLLSTKPTAVVCEMENNIDNLMYSHVLTGVSNSGFWISFSDNLSSSGYALYTTITI